MLSSIGSSAFSSCSSSQVVTVDHRPCLSIEKYLVLGQVWGNLISFLVLKPVEKTSNETDSTVSTKYDKCGAQFSEQEYKGVEVVNQIDRKTVEFFGENASNLTVVL